MGKLKEHEPPMTIDEQVENLKSIGLIVDDEEYAKKILNSDDVVTLAEYLKYFDKPEDIVINKLERVEFENTTVYYMLWNEYQELESDEVELLIVYDHESYKVKNCFMLDMEYGAHPDIKALWESRATKANSSYTYSAEEIKTLVSEVADYCDTWIDDEERKNL